MRHVEKGRGGRIVGIMLTIYLILCTVMAVCEEKTKFTVTVNPKFGNYFPGQPVSVTVRAILENAKEKEWGAGIRWYAGDTTGYEESDSVPYEETTEKDRARQSWSRRYRLGPGEHVLCVGLEKPEGKTIRKQCDTVRVGGE